MKATYTPEYQRMRERLRQAREAAGISQKEAADHFGRPQSFVSKVESAERRIDPTELDKFAKLYGLPVSHFLDP